MTLADKNKEGLETGLDKAGRRLAVDCDAQWLEEELLCYMCTWLSSN